MGRTIGEALARARKGANASYRYSYDMLGEAALTEADALRYLDAYRKAIHAIGADFNRGDDSASEIFARTTISVKLSALHPRYAHSKRARQLAELTPRVLGVAQWARSHGNV